MESHNTPTAASKAPEPSLPENAAIATPLAEMHRGAGAHICEWFGCGLPGDFGNPREEQRFAHESVALIDKNYRAYFTFTGPDRVRYLNAVLTNDIKTLGVGHSNVSLLLNPQGRILAEIETYALPDRLLCVSYAMIRARLAETLEKYIIMDDVTLTDDTEQFGTLGLEGPKTAEVVRELMAVDFAAMADSSSVDTAVRNPESGRAAIPCRLVRRSAVNAEFIAARKDLAALWKIGEVVARKHGGGPMGYSALSARRLAQGVAWFGYDFGEKQIPHEAGLQDSHISYSKGCYTGQEIVERVRSRGQVNRQRVGLRFAETAANVPATGAALTVSGTEVGYITRAAQSFYPPAILAMAYVRKEGAAVGTALDCGDLRATVVKLPLPT
ncbi:MAG TPA: glycine cleavage T C-terminal barrel domain-containing protein [Candidatus Dormibacteraeota bacterium]|nr:glycine cleavage T C-terminal barrel domain-containing protein [Candidatus Dormibacteraeota bacterium]